MAVPAATPYTAPVVGFIVAMDGERLLQVPPPVASLNVIVCPLHTYIVPPIAAGRGTTVTG